MQMEMPPKWKFLKEVSDPDYLYMSVQMPQIEERGQLIMKAHLARAMDLMKEMAEALQQQIEYEPSKTFDVCRDALKSFQEWK